MKDLIIIGAGPAGLSASIYGMRAGLDLVVVERLSPGGQVLNTYEIENYPGFVDPVQGWELVSAMENQAKRLGVEITSGDVVSVEKNESGNHFDINLVNGQKLQSRTVVVATGASHQKLSISGEEELTGRGVSYCATCDGAFFRDKVTAVVGGGNTALEEAVFLTKFASKVYLIHRRDQFRGVKILQDRVLSNEKIEPVYDTVVTSINGKDGVDSITLKNKKTNKESDLSLDGVFIFVGLTLNTGFLSEEILNEKGEIKVDNHAGSLIPGLFAAGDIREDSMRQIVTAAADGATAAMGAYDFILNLSS